MRRLTDSELTTIRDALTSGRGDALRQGMFEVNLGLPITAPDGVAYARELGWLDGANQFSELGALVRDPLREYSLWLLRNGVMMSGDIVPELQREHYDGKRVLELGSGSGCNLLTLQGLDGQFVGLEPMPAFVQMTPILARLAGTSQPEIALGFAERIPFADDSFDIVLCYSSHQYMDIDLALAEMVRVVAPDGTLIIIGNSLHPFMVETVERFVTKRRLGSLKYDLQAIGNTLAYQVRKRRIFGDADGTTTGMPVYPSDRYMRRRLEALGFRVDPNRTAKLPSRETALFAVRR